ncbi:hypothetical protein MMC28_003651 [Mycoblastus sanguinarius]|nr:hypothetical protein [Mycoblastus sanguinarius]
MASTGINIDVRFHAGKVCYLSGERAFNIMVLINLHAPTPVTILRSGTILDPEAIKSKKLVQVIDEKTGESVDLFPESSAPFVDDPAVHNEIPSLCELQPGKPEYLIFTDEATRRERDLPLNRSLLAVDQNYTVQYRAADIAWWSFDSKEKILEHFKEHRELPPAAEEPIQYQIDNSPSFTVRRDRGLIPSPKVTVSLSSSSTICCLNGTQPFTYSLTFTSHATQPITVLAERPLVRDTCGDIVILDASSRERAGPDLIDVNDDGPWEPQDFLRLEPNKPFTETRTLSTGVPYSDTADLVKGKGYIIRYQPNQWMWWGFDDIPKVMQYAGNRGESNGLASSAVNPIMLRCDDKICFTTE